LDGINASTRKVMTMTAMNDEIFIVFGNEQQKIYVFDARTISEAETIKRSRTGTSRAPLLVSRELIVNTHQRIYDIKVS
jgi:hypothetical protein